MFYMFYHFCVCAALVGYSINILAKCYRLIAGLRRRRTRALSAVSTTIPLHPSVRYRASSGQVGAPRGVSEALNLLI